MSIPIQCECGKRLSAQDEWAGKRVKCPACGQSLLITTPEPEPEPAPREANPFSFVADPEPPAKPSEPAPAPARKKPGRRKREAERLARAQERKKRLLWIGGGSALALAVVVGAVLLIVNMGRSPRPGKASSPEVASEPAPKPGTNGKDKAEASPAVVSAPSEAGASERPTEESQTKPPDATPPNPSTEEPPVPKPVPPPEPEKPVVKAPVLDIREVRRLEMQPKLPVVGIALSADGRQAMCASLTGTLQAWDMDTGRARAPLETPKTIVHGFAFSPDGKRVLLGCDDNTLRLCDVASGKVVRSFKGQRPEKWVSVAFSADGTRAVSGGDDAGADNPTVRLWDVATGRELRILKGHTAQVSVVAFSPDGRRVLSGSWDQKLRLWDAATGQEVRRFVGHTKIIQSAVFSPDGRRILSGGADNTARLWDVETGKELQRVEDPAGSVNSVGFLAGGRYALTIARGKYDYQRLPGGRKFSMQLGKESSVRFWDTDTGREAAQLPQELRSALKIALSRDGRRALTANFDGDLRVWDFPDVQSLPPMVAETPPKPEPPSSAPPPTTPAPGVDKADIYHFRGTGKVIAAAKNLRVTEETAGSTRSTVLGGDGVIGQMEIAPGTVSFTPDTPGATGLHIVISPKVGYTTVAGLRFQDEATIDIRADGVVLVNKEGVRASDKLGAGTYVARAMMLDGKKGIVMVKGPAR